MLPEWCSRLENPTVYGDYIVSLDDGILYMYLRRGTTDETHIVVPKYIFTLHPTPWRFDTLYLRRLLDTYAPSTIGRTVAESPRASFNPLYATHIVEVNLKYGDLLHCSSLKAAETIVKRDYGTPQAHAFRELKMLLSIDVRVTGSLLLLATHERSDLDVVIDSGESVGKVIERLKELVNERARPLNGRELEEWAIREAAPRRVEPLLLIRTYRPWQRFVYGGVVVSVALVSDRLRATVERRVFKIGSSIVKGVLVVEGYEDRVLDYPAVAEVRDGCCDVVVSFDGIFVPALVEGGKLAYRGVRGTLHTGSEELSAIYVGIREEPGTFIAPI